MVLFLAQVCDMGYRNFPISRWVSCPCRTLSLAVAHTWGMATDAEYDDADDERHKSSIDKVIVAITSAAVGAGLDAEARYLMVDRNWA